MKGIEMDGFNRNDIKMKGIEVVGFNSVGLEEEMIPK
jgi:hypothetical protein